ncbi:MAG: hypothetical protein INR71_06065 [Terriglobus roseus]|nr:hypothetical protein [Terriglobus roseus]
MQQAFQQEPPLYAKPKPTTARAHTQTPAGARPALPQKPDFAPAPRLPSVSVPRGAATPNRSDGHDRFASTSGQVSRGALAQPVPRPDRGPPGPSSHPGAYRSSSLHNYLDEEVDSLVIAPPAHVDPAIRGPPPPRPVHPATLALRQAVWAKLTSGVDRLSQSLGPEHENLTSLQGDLLQGEPALADELARLQAVTSVCSGVGNRYIANIAAAEANLSDFERKGEVDPDEIVCSTTVLFNQCVRVQLD